MSTSGRLRVLLDTGPVFALLYTRDSKHLAAIALLERLEAAGAEVTLAYPAALEAHRLMLVHPLITTGRAHELIGDALDVFPKIVPTLEDADAAMSDLRRYNDQKISLTDATIAAMSRRERMVVATFDEKQRHFELMKAKVYAGGSN